MFDWLTTSPGFLPALLCEKWSGFFYVHRVWLSYTQDRRLKVSSERLGNEDKVPCQRALLPRRDLNSCGTSSMEVCGLYTGASTARPRQLLINLSDWFDRKFALFAGFSQADQRMASRPVWPHDGGVGRHGSAQRGSQKPHPHADAGGAIHLRPAIRQGTSHIPWVSIDYIIYTECQKKLSTSE